MPRGFVSEKGEMDILGHHFKYEMLRSKEPSAFGIQGSRVFELNLYRDGTLVADYNKKWIKIPYTEDDASSLAIQEIISRFGQAKAKKIKKIKKEE